jgi:hypothetical protein
VKNLGFHFFVWCFLPFFTWAQPFTQTVKGKVVESGIGKPLRQAHIQLLQKGNKWNTQTDSLGFFRIENVTIGRVDVLATLENYETVTLNNLLLSTGKELDLTIEMTEKTGRKVLSDVTVSKKSSTNDAAVNSVKNFSTEETQRFAASFNDPARMALSLAGVNATNDASNEIVVRGNSSRGILWRVEGIEIPNPNHFSNGEGGSGGGISILSGQVLSNSSFYSGAFPSEFGNALSGVFDIRFRKGNTDKKEFSVQLGILGLQSSLETPISRKKSGSILVNYRYSTLIFLNAIGLPVVDNAMVPQFQDLSYNVYLPTRRLGVFTLFGLGGISTAGDYAVKDSLEWEQRSDRFEDESYQFVGVSGCTHTLPLHEGKGFLKTVLALTKETQRYRMDSLDDQYQVQPAFVQETDYQALRAHSFYSRKINAALNVRAGIYYSQLYFNLFSKGLDINTNQFGTFVEDKGSTGLIQSYVQAKWRPISSLELVGGVHYTMLRLNQKQNLEPRVAGLFRIAANHSLSLAFGVHSRCEPISLYLSQIANSGGTSQPNKELALTRAFHGVLGHEWSLSAALKLKTEAYVQYLYQVPVDTSAQNALSILNAGLGIHQNSFVNQGEGRNYGLEFTLDRAFSSQFFYMLTGSLFQSEYRMPQNDWRSTRFNANGMCNVMVGYEWNFGRSDKNALALNTRIILRGGNRYTPIDEDLSKQEGKEVLVKTAQYEARLPAYFRMDASAALRFNYQKWALVFSTEIQNVTNQQNVSRYYYDPLLQQVRTLYMFGIMPVFNVKVEF